MGLVLKLISVWFPEPSSIPNFTLDALKSRPSVSDSQIVLPTGWWIEADRISPWSILSAGRFFPSCWDMFRHLALCGILGSATLFGQAGLRPHLCHPENNYKPTSGFPSWAGHRLLHYSCLSCSGFLDPCEFLSLSSTVHFRVCLLKLVEQLSQVSWTWRMFRNISFAVRHRHLQLQIGGLITLNCERFFQRAKQTRWTAPAQPPHPGWGTCSSSLRLLFGGCRLCFQS